MRMKWRKWVGGLRVSTGYTSALREGFRRPEPRRRSLDYLKGLLSPVERKKRLATGGAGRGRHTLWGAASAVKLHLGRGPGSR